MKKITLTVCIFLVLCSLLPTNAQTPHKLTVSANKPFAEVSPTMWGIFFEDINFAADGGIYAELVKNGSFEFLTPLMGWKETRDQANGSILVINRGEANANNPRFARISVDAANGSYGFINEGFRGMGVKQGNTYHFSVFARKSGEGNVTMNITLLSSTGAKIGETSIPNFTDDWKKYSASFTSSATDAKAKLKVSFSGKGSVDVDLISLFPQDTWKNRPNGLRADLVQYLYDLKPGFIRFPGGCIVEGRDLQNRYQWKNTVGKPEDRKLIINRWNTEFKNKLTPDYFQSYGLGFYEYFQLAEDIGAEPLPILNCGMACQYNTGEVVPVEQLDPYIQDMLDLIEFANGSTETKWGRLRAEMGHAAPFNLKMMGVGNEQWDAQYMERYTIISKVLKEKYPEIQLVSSSGPSPDGPRFDYLWNQLKKVNADLIDEHYYKPPQWFLTNASRYDNYDRKGPKVFAGEYASHTKGGTAAESKNNWESALSEAAFMTGLERNADVVKMASYAPLFAHLDAWQWNPDLIWFDNLYSFGTPNYYIQKLFANNKGTNVVPILEEGKIIAGKDSIYASAVIDKKSNELMMKLVNVSSKPVAFSISMEGVSVSINTVDCQLIGSDNPEAFNSIENPKTIYPQDSKQKISGKKIDVKLNGRSVMLVKVPCKKL